jgi:hypothetical protein
VKDYSRVNSDNPSPARSVTYKTAGINLVKVLGGFGLCWCHLPTGHDWPGKEEKAPHPR